MGGALFDNRPGMTQSIICQRAFEFAVRIVKLCENMSTRRMGAHHIAKQLIRCGTSIGANAEEAQEGQSKADYVAKMCVSSKEARESGYWLRLAVAVSSVNREEVAWGTTGGTGTQVHDPSSYSHRTIIPAPRTRQLGSPFRLAPVVGYFDSTRNPRRTQARPRPIPAKPPRLERSTAAPRTGRSGRSDRGQAEESLQVKRSQLPKESKLVAKSVASR